MPADRPAVGMLLRGAAAVGAAAALPLVMLLWWVDRSDEAVARGDLAAAARSRRAAARFAPLVPGAAADLVPLFGITAEERSRILPAVRPVLAGALDAAPGDYRVWRALLAETPAAEVAAAEGASAGMTYAGRGLALTWIESGDRHLADGRVDAAVADYAEGIGRTPPHGFARAVYARLYDAGVPVAVVLSVCPATEAGRAELADVLMKAGDPEAASTVARKGLEENPGSKRLADMLRGADQRLRALNAAKEKMQR